MKRILLLACAILAGFAVQAAVRLPRLVGDNMVLQQQTDVCLWGWSDKGSKIEVKTSWGASANAKTDNEGVWKLSVATPAASFEPQTITICQGKQVVELRNILIGEVWLCSGQSNMDMPMAGYWGNPVEGYNDYAVESAQNSAIRHFKVKLTSSTEPQDDVQGEWQVASPQTMAWFGATAYLYARELLKALNVPVGVINSSWGGSCIEAWMSADSQKQFNDMNPATATDENVNPTRKPVTIYNAMLLPVVNYTIKGFVWYQGCANVERYATYADKMAAMIGLWREQWGLGDLPFYYVEIAPYAYSSPNGTEAAMLREQQAKVMKMVKNTGMAVTNDLVYPYEVNNIHPCMKGGVAKRLAAWALSRDYGFDDMVRTLGPQFKSVDYANGKAVVRFDNVPNRLGYRGEICGFEVAGADGVFHSAKASRNSFGDDFITVWADEVTEPQAVRYCFRNFLVGNVYDNFGMPLTAFRTDSFEK